MLEFLDGFLGRMHRDDRGWRQAVGIFTEDIRVKSVEGAAGRPAQLTFADMWRTEPGGWIQQGKVDSLVKSLMQQLRKSRGGAVELFLMGNAHQGGRSGLSACR
jgi:hypothetical protein